MRLNLRRSFGKPIRARQCTRTGHYRLETRHAYNLGDTIILSGYIYIFRTDRLG
jgi:hypothetical protein